MKVGDGGNTHTAAPKAHKRKKEMFVSLSKITSFEVGGFAHRQSWGKRCNGRKERREQSSTQVDSAGKWNSRYFSITEYLGSGHFGDIYLGVYNNENDRELHGQSVALKRFSKKRILKEAQNKGRFLELLQREINIHSS